MTWTTFGALTNPTLPELDANLAVLSMLNPIPVTVAGTNALTLTSTAGATAISAYQNYMTFIGIAANTNNTGVTAAVVGIQSGAFLNIYKDSLSGPVLLTGGELVQSCAFTLRYDSTLNANAGGFHLVDSGAGLFTGQTFSISAINVASASISGVLSVASVSFAGGDAVTRFTSTLASVTIPIVPQTAFSQVTISFAGCQINDNIFLGAPSLPASNIAISGFVSAAGSVVMRVANLTTNATVTLGSIAVRVTNLGFAT